MGAVEFGARIRVGVGEALDGVAGGIDGIEGAPGGGGFSGDETSIAVEQIVLAAIDEEVAQDLLIAGGVGTFQLRLKSEGIGIALSPVDGFEFAGGIHEFADHFDFAGEPLDAEGHFDGAPSGDAAGEIGGDLELSAAWGRASNGEPFWW